MNYKFDENLLSAEPNSQHLIVFCVNDYVVLSLEPTLIFNEMFRAQRYSYSYFHSTAVSGSGGPSLADAYVAKTGAGPYHSVRHYVRLRSAGSAHRPARRGQLPHSTARSESKETGAA